MIWFTVLGIVAVVAYYLAIEKASKNTLRPMASLNRHDNSISVDKARELFEKAATDSRLTSVTNVGEQVRKPMSVSPLTDELFSKYTSIATRRGGFRIGLDEIRTSEYIVGFISIGHSEDWDIVQIAGHDGVYIVEGSEKSEDDIEIQFPSVYHLVLDELDFKMD